MTPESLQSELSGRLHDTALGTDLLVLGETGSTNDEALNLAREGAPHGTVVIALSQTSGRGRLGRTWSNEKGHSLCLSLLLRPGMPMREAGRLTFHAGLACHRALSSLTGLPLQIKWPNDLLWENRKICGILTESLSKDGSADAVVVGFGCNLNQSEKDFPLEIRSRAASLAQLTGKYWGLADVAVSILREMGTALNEPWPCILNDWKQHCPNLGKMVRVSTGAKTFEALLLDIDAEGALLLELSDGVRQRLHSAEIL